MLQETLLRASVKYELHVHSELTGVFARDESAADPDSVLLEVEVEVTVPVAEVEFDDVALKNLSPRTPLSVSVTICRYHSRDDWVTHC